MSRLNWSFFFDIGVFLDLCTSFLSVFLVLRMDDGVFGVFVTNAESGAGSTIGS